MSEERNFEQEARQDGWRPQEEWNGDPEKWVDAETFVERGEKITGILKSKADRLEQRLHKLEHANKKFGEYHKQQLDAQKRAAEQKIERLEDMLAEAISNGDGQAYNMLNKEITNLRQSVPNAPDYTEFEEIDPTGQAWLNENQWYGQDPTLSTFADGAADRLKAQGFGGKAYYDELTRMVREAFPHKFENPNRGKDTSVNDGDPGEAAPSKGRSYKNLPADAKAACDEFVEAGFMTREEYLKTYDWEDE